MISLPLDESESTDFRENSESDPSAFDEEWVLSEPLSCELASISLLLPPSDPDCDLLEEVPEIDSEENEASSNDKEREVSVESDPVEPETEESELEEDDEDEVPLPPSFSSPLVSMTGGLSRSESSTEPLPDGAPYR